MEHPVEAHWSTRLHAERDDVLDLEVDRVTHLDAVAQAFLADLDRGALHTEVLADEWSEGFHRTAELSAENAEELFHLLVGRLVVYEDSEPPVSLGHDLRGIGDRDDCQAAHIGAFDVSLT